MVCPQKSIELTLFSFLISALGAAIFCICEPKLKQKEKDKRHLVGKKKWAHDQQKNCYHKT